MRIVADENIPLLDEFFAQDASITRLPGRAISAADVQGADVLLVRSVTKVDLPLLAGSAVRFVGTCTIGTDHLDLDYFAQAGIHWASAPGCNARGVVDYILGSLLALAEREGADLSQRTYGVVGAGEVGGRLVKVMRELGWRVLVCDPPRADREGGDYHSLDALLSQCDVLSLHTPLSNDGPLATRHLLAAEQLQRLRPGAWLINASRGAVLDNAALYQVLLQRPDLQVVLDVWEGEPLVDVPLAGLCQIATPHIAGYSLDGKLRGTAQIYQAYCAWRKQAVTIELADLLPKPWLSTLELDGQCSPAWALATLCRAVYDPRRDDADFRRSLVGAPAERRAAFDALRKHYPHRRETDGLQVRATQPTLVLRQVVQALGATLIGRQ
ncbi:MAG: 4-phosphoerythronate dehydrogenase PdxB [Pseudomonas sp.]|uniref:4-phosphoerythronate dehydrogenase PdxB n=1 Tax=Pseudomonas sp. TaxID=306 RepID=UPI002734CB6D|nr:4-phosphoerythronate dehydrogenase PdxB [Pseudomonas sp.]MDP3845008.1 4-phosphoerythronate dehydrogenase PdxB [Pseudomonas sp.]